MGEPYSLLIWEEGIKIDRLFRINPKDNVAIALTPFQKGEVVEFAGEKIDLLDDVPQGHKVATQDINNGAEVIRYGHFIGRATTGIKKGQWVHSHNLTTGLKGKLEYGYNPVINRRIDDTTFDRRQIPAFKGYRREDGKIGVRNEVWIINTVGCVNKLSEKLAFLAREEFKDLIKAGEIDGIHSFSHPYGCSQLGDDMVNTQKILAALVNLS